MNDVCFPYGASLNELSQHIIQNGCFNKDENARLFREWYLYTRPRDRLLNQLDKIYKFSRGTVLDAGCGYGSHVARGQSGSYGIELDEHRFKFTCSLGLPCYQRDLVEDDLSDLPQVDVVFCLAVLEHIESEHVVLRKLVERVKSGGYLVIGVPSRPIFRKLENLFLFKRLFNEHGDHINGYTPQTLAFQCERAGVTTLISKRYCVPMIKRVPSIPYSIMNYFPLSLVSNACIYIGQKQDEWEYPLKSTRQRADNKKGYVPAGGYLKSDRELSVDDEPKAEITNNLD